MSQIPPPRTHLCPSVFICGRIPRRACAPHSSVSIRVHLWFFSPDPAFICDIRVICGRIPASLRAAFICAIPQGRDRSRAICGRIPASREPHSSVSIRVHLWFFSPDPAFICDIRVICGRIPASLRAAFICAIPQGQDRSRAICGRIPASREPHSSVSIRVHLWTHSKASLRAAFICVHPCSSVVLQPRSRIHLRHPCHLWTHSGEPASRIHLRHPAGAGQVPRHLWTHSGEPRAAFICVHPCSSVDAFQGEPARRIHLCPSVFICGSSAPIPHSSATSVSSVDVSRRACGPSPIIPGSLQNPTADYFRKTLPGPSRAGDP